MSCLELPELPHPDLSLLIPSFDIDIGIPSLGLALCCKLQTPPIPFPQIPLDAIFALLASVASSALDAILKLINSIIDLLNSLIDLIPPVSCPFDELK